MDWHRKTCFNWFELKTFECDYIIGIYLFTNSANLLIPWKIQSVWNITRIIPERFGKSIWILVLKYSMFYIKNLKNAIFINFCNIFFCYITSWTGKSTRWIQFSFYQNLLASHISKELVIILATSKVDENIRCYVRMRKVQNISIWSFFILLKEKCKIYTVNSH